MKKISILCAALAMAALSFTSCQKEESATANQKFIASFEQTGFGKFSVDEDLQMYWDTANENTSSASNLCFVFAPGFSQSDGENAGCGFTTYSTTDISSDGKTAVLEYTNQLGYAPFPANQQGPFYVVSNISSNVSWGWPEYHINSDGSFHIGLIYELMTGFNGIMPMIARADNFGRLKFKHIFGLLKIYVNLPEGFEVSRVTLSTTHLFANDPLTIDGCDVYWDANGDISLANIDRGIRNIQFPLRRGNGFYIAPVCPGDWGDLGFIVRADDSNQQSHRFIKTMAEGATIHIERAGITTLTLNYTENDIVDY